MEEFAIKGRRIGSAHRPYLIAEMSANHGGDIERARRIIRLAAENGADAIKLQAYTADDLTIDSDAPDFQLKSGLWAGQTLYQLYRSASTPYEWLGPLFEEAERAGITAFATPFSAAAVDHLAKLGAPAYKIASFEAIDLELIQAAARTGKPLIISTGLCEIDDIARALDAARGAGARDIAILKCTSAYPAEPDTQNLFTIPDMAARFRIPIGFSDHTIGSAAAISAVALGATVVEKHFIDSHEPPTVDSTFSCLPDDLQTLRSYIDAAWKARGIVQYGATAGETASLVYRRSLYVVSPVAKGETIEKHHIRSIRPGHGIPPRNLPEILGSHAARDLRPGEALKWDMVNPK